MKKFFIGIIVFTILCSFGAFSFDLIEQQGGEDDVVTHSPTEIEGGTFPEEEEYDFNGKIYVSTPSGYTIGSGEGLITATLQQDNAYAVMGKNEGDDSYGVYGYSSDSNSYGIYAKSEYGHGVYGLSGSNAYCGVYGKSNSGEYAGLGCGYYDVITNGDVYIDGNLYISGGDISDVTGPDIDFYDDVDIQGNTVEIHDQLYVSTSGDCCVDGTCGDCEINDIAETFYTKEEPGTVVSFCGEDFKKAAASAKAYDTKVIGVVSENPTIIMGEETDDALPIALSGIIKTKASAENGPIRVGDLLTTANTPGHVMKCDDKIKCYGALVGKALEPLNKGTGEIVIFIMRS